VGKLKAKAEHQEVGNRITNVGSLLIIIFISFAFGDMMGNVASGFKLVRVKSLCTMPK
jgi:hypothetical protein